MPEAFHRYIIEIHSEAGQPLGQVAVQVDFAPAFEWTRLAGARSGRVAFGDYDRPASVLPLWHARLSRPYLKGFRVQLDSNGAEDFFCDFPLDYFKGPATQASAPLVEAGKLRAGDRFLYLVSAYPIESGTRGGNGGRFEVTDIAPSIPARESLFSEFFRTAKVQGNLEEGQVPVFISGRVLNESTLLTQEAQEVETGGFLIGHLHHDREAPDVFVEVTAQVPATGTVGEPSRLMFTSDSWTAARSAITLRRRDEIFLGWWHSHPLKYWGCRNCPPEKQRACALFRGFLSEHDRSLHRAVFSRAWCIALVVSDGTGSDPTLSVFGWNRGLLEPRGFYVLDSTV